jgi:hypothetical protein
MDLRRLVWIAALCVPVMLQGQSPEVDSDGDGLSDALEQSLLVQFAPSFMIAEKDCSNVPAEFLPGRITPTAKVEDGTIYGQVFPVKDSTGGWPVVEIHYYHLWREDCGRRGHALDTEHVAAQVRASESDLSVAKWKAMYWYAAAHEDTVCDVSQITRASTVAAEDRGAKVWISRGKHASYLNATLCEQGCGADICDGTTPLAKGKVINLGESGHPMNGSVFTSSQLWPLAAKMETSNFPEGVVARLNEMPVTEIAWVNAGRHPVQGVIAVSGSTGEAIARSGANTTAAISLAGGSTGDAISITESSTGNALEKSYHKTVHALVLSGQHVGNALGLTKMPSKPEP